MEQGKHGEKLDLKIREEFCWHQWALSQAVKFQRAALAQTALTVFRWLLERGSFGLGCCAFSPRCNYAASFTECTASLTPPAFILFNTVSFSLRLRLPRREGSREKLLMRGEQQNFLCRLVNGEVYQMLQTGATFASCKFRATDVSFVQLLLLFKCQAK